MGVMASVGSAWERARAVAIAGASRCCTPRPSSRRRRRPLAAAARSRFRCRSPRHPLPRRDAALGDPAMAGAAVAAAGHRQPGSAVPARAALRGARCRDRALARVRTGRREAHRLPGDERRPPAADGGVPAGEEDRRRPASGHRRRRGSRGISSPSTATPSPTSRSPSTSPSAMPAASSDSGFTDVERKRLDTAKQLLTVAIDQAATPAERQLAYRRVREELDGLISLSDEAIDVLEKKVSLELTTGRRPRRPRRLPPRGKPAAAPQRRAAADRPASRPTPSRGAPGRCRRAPPRRRPGASCTPSRDPDAGVSSVRGRLRSLLADPAVDAARTSRTATPPARPVDRDLRARHPPGAHRDLLVHRQLAPDVGRA